MIVKNQSKKDFAIVPNKLINDASISLEARMMFVHLSSKPDNWNVVHSEIQKCLNIKSKTTMAKYSKELEDSGWISREKLPNGSYVYTLNSTPASPKNGRPKNGLGSPNYEPVSPKNEPDPSPNFSNCQKMDPNNTEINNINKIISISNTNFLENPREVLDTFLSATSHTFTNSEKSSLADLLDFKKLTINDAVVIRTIIKQAKQFKLDRPLDNQIIEKACDMCISTGNRDSRFVLPFAQFASTNQPFHNLDSKDYSEAF